MLKSKINQLLTLMALYSFYSIPLSGQTEIKIHGIIFPSFTTSQRNLISATSGQCIYNLSNDFLECYDGSQWKSSSNNDNQLWIANNSQNPYVTNGTKVGIGTSAPAASLQIDSPVDVDPFRARVASSTKLRVHSNGSVSVGTASVGTENGLYVLGNVGVGTSSPNSKMVLNDNNWQLSLDNNNVGGEDWYIGSSSDDWNAGGGKFILSKTNNSSGAALVVDNTDKVGISTNNPSTKLHVVGGNDVGTVSGGYITVGSDNSTHIAIDNNEIMARNNGVVAPLALNAEGGEVTVNIAGSLNSDAMEIVGRVNFNNGGNSGMRISATNSSPTNALFEPTLFEEGLIGFSGNPFWRMYSREFYARTAIDFKTYSDRRLKGNILPIKNALDKINDIEGVSYALTASPLGKRIRPLTKQEKFVEDNQLGFIAQDIAKVLPQIVTKDESSGLYTVAYMGVIPVLVEAIKEQQSTIETLEKQMEVLLKKNEISMEINSNLETRFKVLEDLISQGNTTTLTSSN